VNEIPVSPDTLSWLGERFGYVGQPALTEKETQDGVERADNIIGAWASTPKEVAFLEALSVGHEIAEARRLSRLTRAQSDSLLRRMRGVSDESHTRL
jgi:hypothetical protein